ncbi:MAG: hypothetical protein Q7V31_03685 [Parvibaculum sp.]|uniref:hypothetical protein n=1 Tax=Parvibaculum sp. TaxID=2024848 RepID=UPI00272602AA|nr:hypothetical protein [Parvibaculum sp.]MDO8838004.1 hypothetical protein [Parvibaculum sp.]
MTRLCTWLFIGAAAVLQAGCVSPAREVMGPVRLVETGIDIPASAFVCRDAPPAPADYFDGLEHADWLAGLWFSREDCAAKLKKAGEMVLGTGE